MAPQLKRCRVAMAALAAPLLALAIHSPGFAQIKNWQTGQIIAGTEHVTLGPLTYFGGFRSNARNLNYADLAQLDLRNSIFHTIYEEEGSWLDSARFTSTNLTGASMIGVRMENADFANANLTGVQMNKADLYGSNFTSANLTSTFLYDSDLRNADFSGADLSNASLPNAHVIGANFTGANIRGTTLSENFVSPPPLDEFTKEQLYSTASYQEKNLEGVRLGGADIQDWDFTGQNIQRMSFAGSTLTKEQLYSTASYQQKNLHGIELKDGLNLRGWDFSGQDLTGASFAYRSNLTGANFTDAIIAEASFEQIIGESNRTTLTKEQIYSTASYKQKNLKGIKLAHNILKGIDLSGQDLRDSSFAGTDLTGANLSGALIHASNPTGRGNFASVFWPTITKAQFYSTGSYEQKNLRGILFMMSSMNGWDLSGQNLSNSSFFTDLRNANLTDALINDTWFNGARISKEQLYSTASFKNKDLRGIAIQSQSLTDCDLTGQDLTGMQFFNTQLQGTDFTDAVISNVSFNSSAITADQLYSTASYKQKSLAGVTWGNVNLSRWNFQGQDLSNGLFFGVTLSGTDFTDAIVRGASFETSLSKAQLFSTASYKNKDLRGIQVVGMSLRNVDLRGMRMTDAIFNWYDVDSLVGADLSFADLRGAMGSLTGATTRNAILPSGYIMGLDLATNESLTIHDHSAVAVHNVFTMSPDSELRLVLDADDWNSTISFEPGIAVALGGTLDLQFEPDVDLSSRVGATFHLFDWLGVTPTGHFSVTDSQHWDLSNLYSTGQIVFLGAGELRGDWDSDGQLTALDVDRLSAEIRSENPSAGFDINADGVVDGADRTSWVHDGAKTYFGDANLDGQFNSTDMISVFQSGQYEDTIAENSGWATGDWNGDREFNTEDFVIAFQDGGYEQPSPAVSIPEPSTLLGLAGLIMAARRRRDARLSR